MATQRESGNPLQRLYSDRIGQPNTDDEVMGYWVFALGALLGIVGFLLFVPSERATDLRQTAVVVSALGLPLVLAGPIIRLPLERTATMLVAVGGVVCVVALAWFVTVYPGGWSPRTGRADIMGLYGLGLVSIAAGGVLVPMLSSVRRDPEEESDRNAALVEQREDALADEADLAQELEDSRDERDDLQEEIDDTLADEDDLARELEDSRAAGATTSAAAERPESQASFEIYEDDEGTWRWRLRHRNGNVLADSGRGYARRTGAQNSMQSVRRDAFGAAAIAITPEGDADESDEDDASGAVTVADADESKATFEIYEDEGGEQWRWRLLHDNGNIIADGSEGYASKSNVQRAMDEIRGHVAAANYLHVDPVAYELYEDEEGQWRWRLIHENGNVLASAARGYDARPDARDAVTAVKETLSDAEVTER